MKLTNFDFIENMSAFPKEECQTSISASGSIAKIFSKHSIKGKANHPIRPS